MTAQLTLWPRGREQVEILPDFLRFVCEYDEYVFIDDIRVRLYFERTGLFDVLYYWTEFDDRRSGGGDLEEADPFVNATIAAISPPAGTEAEAVLRMLGPVWRSQSGTSSPNRYLDGDLVSRTSFHRIRDELDAEWKARKKLAETQRGAEIIRVAEELGLHPEPSGNGSNAWYVNCPTRRPHRARAETNEGRWGCGYCRIKGGVEELRDEERNWRKPASAPQALIARPGGKS